MKKILFCLLLLFFAAPTRAQVVVPDTVAGWFLEQNERVKEYVVQVTILRSEISNLKTQISTLESADNKRAEEIDQLKVALQEKQKQETILTDEITRYLKEIVRLQRKVKLIAIIAGIVVFLTLLFK